VERRHTLLERYIDQHLPDPASGPVSADELDAPFGFIANALIFDAEAATANRSKPFGWHHERLAALRTQIRGYIKLARGRVRANWIQLYGGPPRRDDLLCPREVDREGLESVPPDAPQGQPNARAARQLRDAIEALAFVCEWDWSVQVAAQEYLRASLDTSRQILTGPPPADPADPDAGEIARHYLHWYDCHGKALLGEPVEIGRSECAIRQRLGLRQDYRDLRTQAVLPRFGRFLAGFRAWRRQIGEEVADALLDSSFKVLRTTRGLIVDMKGERPVSRSDLDRVFAAREKKLLLTFPREDPPADAPETDRMTASQLVDRDMGIPTGGGKLDPRKFKALDYALLLGKLALMDRDALKAVTAAYKGDVPRLSTSTKPKRYSILMDMARSLDGNHQWRRYAMPYPRRAGAPEPVEPVDREYGFDSASGGPWQGFSFYADPELRRTVFKALFPVPFEGRILCRSEFRSTAYQHPVDADDPFRSDRDTFCNSDVN
jgi:hypothetical protein